MVEKNPVCRPATDSGFDSEIKASGADLVILMVDEDNKKILYAKSSGV